ncbi:hypothetical protein FO519_008240 [Halicephalobus sp. NKZ332]|nr:hypothetical protein FO519_008240 [Halicephalobus sp. NKZ332]
MTKFVLPGDRIVPENQLASDKKHKICGRGIAITNNQSVASVSGFVHENKEKIWVNSHYRRYFPQHGDKVIGIITQKTGDTWKVDIGGIEKAEIDFMSFENATKKNRPDLKPGDMIYGMVNVINKHLEPTMTCIDNTGRAHGMGHLAKSGLVFTVPCSYCRRLLIHGCEILTILGKSFIFEVTIGVNGRIWINGEFDAIRLLKKIFLRLETVPDSEVEAVVHQMVLDSKGGDVVVPRPEVESMEVDVKPEVKDEALDDDAM